MNFFKQNNSSNKNNNSSSNKRNNLNIKVNNTINKLSNNIQSQDKEIIVNQEIIPRNYPEIKDKYHFFIGNFIKDHVQISILKDLKKKLRAQYKIDYASSYDNFFLCFKNIYIGYMTNKDADVYMKNILSPLLNTIKNNIGKLNCHYTRFKLKYVKNYIRISLEYEDENNLLSNVIIPYINKNGVEPVYDRKIENSKPSIELIYMKPNQLIPNTQAEISINVPTETFVIDKLSLIRGGLTKLRSGTPSKHDQLIFNNVRHYSFNFE
jgi:hypothetical protein